MRKVLIIAQPCPTYEILSYPITAIAPKESNKTLNELLSEEEESYTITRRELPEMHLESFRSGRELRRDRRRKERVLKGFK